jgi:hypothetical protein
MSLSLLALLPASPRSSPSILWVREHLVKLALSTCLPSLNAPSCVHVCVLTRALDVVSTLSPSENGGPVFVGIAVMMPFPYFVQVKTRMQLERGKSSAGLLGSFRSIIREEGCVSLLSFHSYLSRAELPILIASDVYTAVCRDPF